MYGSWSKEEIFPINPEWLAGYDARGIEYRKLKSETVTWWDRDVLEFMAKAGVQHFRRIHLWDEDWNRKAAQAGVAGDFSDPRNPYDRLVHRLLKLSQGHRENIFTRGLEYLLRRQGW